MKFDEFWQTRGHAMFSAHEEGGQLITKFPRAKDNLLL
jgi:hypothetical protein